MARSLNAFLLGVSAFVLCGRCLSTTAEHQTTRFCGEVTAALDSFTTRLPQILPLPGIAIAIVQGDSIYCKAAGNSRLSHQTPFTDSTVFFTGNLSELMVATAVFKLAATGVLDLDDPVTAHLPYFRLSGDRYHEITIRHLLTHTSGVPQHDALWDLPDTSSTALRSTTQSIAQQQPLFNNPGSEVKRSAYNYDILADLIEHAGGMSLEKYTRQFVFQQLGMDASFFKPDVRDGRLAMPHRINDWLSYTMEPVDSYPYNRAHAGSIGFHSSVRDIATWMHMLLRQDGEFLSEAWCREFMRPQYRTGNTFYIGAGWEMEKYQGLLICKKSHRTGGFSADLTLIPERKTGIFVVSNIGDDFNPAAIGRQIMTYLHDHQTLRLRIPVHIAIGKMLSSGSSLDSAIQWYNHLELTRADEYDLGAEALSQLGINLLYRENDPASARRIFQFCADRFPDSAVAHLNLAEASLVSNDLEQVAEALAVAKQLPADTEVAARLRYVEEMLAIRRETKSAITN